MNNQTINIIAIIISPIIAILISLWLQDRKQIKNSQHKLFNTLMAHRKSYSPTYEWVNALNVIDVIFANYPQVVMLWHEYYRMLCQKEKDLESEQHKYLDLLYSMAKCLKYKKIQQTDIDKFYTPTAHGDQMIINTKIQQEWLRVLENTERFLIVKKDNET